MTFKELYETVIDDLFEKKSDTEMLRRLKNYVNRGYLELAKREGLSKTINGIAMNGRLKKPSDLIKINLLLSDGTPMDFVINAGYIQVEKDGNCELNYIYAPEKLVDDSDETITNSLNDEFIISYAKWCYYSADSMYEDARYWKQELESLKIVQPQRSSKIYDIYSIGGE